MLLKFNIFEFNGILIGTASGTKPAPSYASIFMADIDNKIQEITVKLKHKLSSTAFILKFFKRFLDDLFLIFMDQQNTYTLF